MGEIKLNILKSMKDVNNLNRAVFFNRVFWSVKKLEPVKKSPEEKYYSNC